MEFIEILGAIWWDIGCVLADPVCASVPIVQQPHCYGKSCIPFWIGSGSANRVGNGRAIGT